MTIQLFAQQKNTSTVPGDYYDWKKTMQPEKPWLHDYSKTVVMKLALCTRDSIGNVKHVYLNFEDALDKIKMLDNITLGIPKIVYLVGWQFTGHDSGYPSWSVVNDALKRKQDSTALQSLRWLIKAAKQYHTTVSLHINMFDAFKDSPLWDTYFQNDIILKDKNGTPLPGEVFDGMQSYQISYKREWELGYAQKRIDSLLAMLPELKEGGTIHIDAFHSIQPTRKDDTLSSPYLGYTIDEEITAQRKIYRYWRVNGIDVTSEGDIYWLRKDPFIGLQPMAWHFSINNFKKENWMGKPAGFNSLPPQLYCGTPMQAETEIRTYPGAADSLIKQFYNKVVPWYFTNNSKEKIGLIWHNDENIFLPVLWQPKTIAIYSNNGFVNKKWKLPEEWKTTNTLIYKLSAGGKIEAQKQEVVNNEVILSLKAGKGLIIIAQ